jgi:hypothetical protein
VFFGRLEDSSFTNAFTFALPIAAGMFVLAAALALLLPPTTVSEDETGAADF